MTNREVVRQVTMSSPGQIVTTCLPELPRLRVCTLLLFFLKLKKPYHPPSPCKHFCPNTAVNTLALAIQHYSTVN